MENNGEEEARVLLRKAFGITAARVTRYRTGYCHRVFEVRLRDGATVAVCAGFRDSAPATPV